jgi:hypothetical protein
VGAGAGHADVFEPKHMPAFASQHWMPPGSAGQLFWQSASTLHVGAHFFSAGGGGFVAGGTVVAGGGSDAAGVPSSGTSALFAQAATTRIAVTANADFEKVAYFTERTLSEGPAKSRS